MIISPATNIASSPVTLPDELIAEVLSLLKPKSLLRLKCVSKSWNSLISDPFFVNMHLIKSSRNPNIILFPEDFRNTSSIALLNPFLLLRSMLENPFLIPCSLLENPSIFLFPEDSKYKLMESYCHIIGSCNGLICLVYSPLRVDSPCRNELFLWNPATKWLSQKLASHDSKFEFKFSFGYDNLTDKYKVVAFRPNKVRVLTLGDNVWRNIQSFPTYPYHYTNVCVYLSNSLNWFALRGIRPYYHYRRANLSVQQFVIISLNLEIETYTQFQFPQGFDQVPIVPPIVCRLMESLCFSHYSMEYSIECSFVIWQMKEFGVQESWTKLLKFDYHNILHSVDHRVVSLLPLHVFENGDTLILARNLQQLICYNSRENRVVRQATFTNSIDLRWFKCQPLR
ncbi:F-box/kelch-repeat protein At3g23880-like [Vicia villosa]|uniref:F-box/kelch-repeat protein At3g23880-like n=1 Tax=Vicia villosa TaxID=3911 RepID=UPI00273B2176|nr:F-box/kelch-repeat protein At3g23880-like [Vicia villosa]